MDGGDDAGSDAVAGSGLGGTDFGAPAVRDAASASLLTVAEVARRLGVCRAIVYRVCRDGRLAHVRVSNAIRVPVSALQHYLNTSIQAQGRRAALDARDRDPQE